MKESLIHGINHSMPGSAENGKGKDIDEPPDDDGSLGTGDTEGGAKSVDGSSQPSLVLTFENIKDSPNYLAIADSSTVMGFHELQALNRPCGVFIVLHEGIGVSHHEIAEVMVKVVNNLSPLCVWQLVRSGDADLLLKVLHPIFNDHFMRVMRAKTKMPTRVLKELMHCALESLVLCFASASVGSFTGLSVEQHPKFLTRTSYRVAQAIEVVVRSEARIRGEKLVNHAKDLWWKRRAQFASSTRDVESVVDCSASRKCRVFLNGVTERNDAGANVMYFTRDSNHCLERIEVHYLPLIEVWRGDPLAIREFFEANPKVPPSTMLSILDECVRTKVETITKEGQEDLESFFPEKGCRLSFFIKNINAIRNQLRLRFKARGQVFPY